MRRTIITILALSMLLFGCGALEGEDAEALDDLFQELEQMAESQNNAGQDSGSSSDSDSGADSDSGSENRPPPHSDSPNRPPVPDGGEEVESYFSVGAGTSVEKYEYSPLDASTEDIIDHYDEHFGSTAERDTGTNSDGDWTRWSNEDSFVIVQDTGMTTEVEVHYRD